MGKPILTSNVGDAAYLVRKYKCGIVIKNNQPDCLREGLLQLSSLSTDTLYEMGINARKLASEEFDWNKIIVNLDNEMKGIL